ncbi:hypothetical protein [Streptomyces sp. NPDC093225]|uniref:hypothetical protein n=1 Tax=Streptomyces sp. NPDC093225 TaxID=3366034 RepID=UPI003803EAB7
MFGNRRGALRAGVLVLALLFGLVAWVGAPAAHAVPTVPVSVTVTSVDGVGDDLDGIGRSDADFYAGVEFGTGTINATTTAGNSFGTHVDDAPHITPFWVLSGLVDPFTVNDVPTANLTLSVWDHDDCDSPFCTDTGVTESDDDRLDIKSGAGETVAVALDLRTGRWSGDVNWPTNCVTGDGGEAVKVCFDISVDSASGDADGDGLLDGWERNGYNDDGNGTIDVDLPRFGAEPDHKDLFLELDYSAGQAPARDDVEAVRDAFADAPFDNVDGTRGIRLHVDTGNLVDLGARKGQAPGTCTDMIDNNGDGRTDAADVDCSNTDGGSGEYLETSVEDPQPDCTLADTGNPDCLVGDDLGGGNQLPQHLNNCGLDGVFRNAKDGGGAFPTANFNRNRRLIFRYAISTLPDQDTDGRGPDTGCASGGQGELGGNDFVEYNHDGGTLMHELGHNLNLDHGGDEDKNCKPNYVSVMDYDEQFGIGRVRGGAIIDYSPPRIALNGRPRGVAPLPKLQEDALNENVVLDSTDNENTIVFKDGAGRRRTGPLTGGIDWNGDNADPPFESTVPPTNINTSSPPGPIPAPPAPAPQSPQDCASNTSNTDQNITGHHDWNRVSLPFRQFPASRNGALEPLDETLPTLEDRDVMTGQANTADVSVAIADTPDPVGAGEQLKLSLTATNHGPNPAHSTEVTTTLPEGVDFVDTSVPCVRSGRVVTCNLGSLAANTSKSFDIRVNIPAGFLYPGGQKTITTTASVDNLYGPDPESGNDRASQDTLVITKADVKITDVKTGSPLEVLIGQAAQATVEVTVENGGPSSPVDALLTGTATASSGAGVAPAATSAQQTALAVGGPRTVSQAFSLTCLSPGFKTVSFDYAIALTDPNGVDPVPANNTRSVSFRIDCVVPIAINVRPGGFPNSINLLTDATLAALTTRAGEYGLPLSFDAGSIDPLSARWGLRGNVFNTGTVSGAREIHNRGHIERSYELDERTRDADLDMVMHFKPADSGLTPQSTEACLRTDFRSADGTRFRALGCDSVRITP